MKKKQTKKTRNHFNKVHVLVLLAAFKFVLWEGLKLGRWDILGGAAWVNC